MYDFCTTNRNLKRWWNIDCDSQHNRNRLLCAMASTVNVPPSCEIPVYRAEIVHSVVSCFPFSALKTKGSERSMISMRLNLWKYTRGKDNELQYIRGARTLLIVFDMVSPSEVEVIKHAIKQVIQEVGPSGDKTSSYDDDDEKHDQRLLSRLMSQVSKLKEDDDEDSEDKIVKELKKLNRQSFITNCLLSAIMVLTVTWQISQVSIILKVKDGVTRPFRSAEVGPSGHKTSSYEEADDDDEKHDQRLLSRLMSQLEMLESEPEELPSAAVSKSESTINADSTNMNNNEVSKLKEDDDDKEQVQEKIVKELKKLNRQSFITNCLLSAIIVLTVTWQISKVSIILKVKDGVTHPFRSVGSLFTSMIKRPKPNEQNSILCSIRAAVLTQCRTRSGYVGSASRSMVDMVSPSKVEVIKHAVKQVMQEVGPSGNKTSFFLSDDDKKHDHRILTKLMSQITVSLTVGADLTIGLRYMDLFNLIRVPNPTKVKIGSRPRAAHEVPLLTLTANRVVEMEDPAAATDSLGIPSTIERSPLDFAHEAGASDQGTMAPEVPPPEDVPATDAPRAGLAEEVAATDPSAATESRKRGRDGTDVNAPPKVLRRDHADPRPTGSTHGGKSLAAIELGLASTRPVFVPENAPAGVSDPDPLSFADPQSRHPVDIAQSSQEWGVANGSMLDTPEACQDLVDHVAPSGYFSELRHLHNDDFLRQYNVNLARQVAMGSQLCLRFEQEVKMLRKSVAQVARQDKRIQARELEIKNLEALLEAEADMNKAAEDKSVGLSQELENMRARFSDLQVSNECLSQQVATLQEQVSGEEELKAAFDEFKRYEDSRVEQRCVEMDARLDALSIDFDEELYPHKLTAIAGRRWVIGRGLRLAVIKYGESLELRQAFADVVSTGIAKCMKAEAKYVAALQALKDLKYPLVDQLEGLKDAPMDVIMAALYLKSDTRNDAPQHIRDLRPSSSQLTIPIYPEVRDPMNPWAYKEKMLLADAIVANISRAEKKKKCRIVCRTYGVRSAHHARSDGVPVSVPTMVPQGLLADAATQTELEEAT
nr:transposase (putative), gypsy type [Tanacetum cinerariifolium]